MFAGFRTAAGRRAGSAAIGADLSAAELDFCLLAENRLFELEREIVANVAAALPAPIATPSAHVEHLAEEVSEDISHIGVGKTLEARSARAAHSRVPVAIVGGALLRVGKYLVRFAGLLELLFRFRIIRVAVGMKLHGQTPVGGL